MTTSSARAAVDTSISLVSMLRRATVDVNGRSVGTLQDAIITLRDEDYPLLSGLVIVVRGSQVFVPADDIISMDGEMVRLREVSHNTGPFERQHGEVLLKRDVLGHRLVDLIRGVFVTAYDIRLAAVDGGDWTAVGVDVHKHGWFHFGTHETHAARDWRDFILLVANQRSANPRRISRIRRLKPAQIADIIEDASRDEQDLLLARVHTDPELEANVFEELDDHSQAKLLKARGDSDIAELLSRMRADDAADAIMDLPQERRQTVLRLLPQPQNTKVLTLLGYNHATAGGLMGTDFLALYEGQTVADAVQMVRAATTKQPEALTSIHSLHSDGRLTGTVSLVRAIQLDPTTLLRDAADAQTISAAPEDDIIAVVTRMADFNLLSLPILDPGGRMLGIVTVDDALEAAIPRDWLRRKAVRSKIV